MSHVDDLSLTVNFSNSCQTMPTPYPHPRLSQLSQTHQVLLFFFFLSWRMSINCLEKSNSKGLQTADKAASPQIFFTEYNTLLFLAFMQISTSMHTYMYLDIQIYSQQINYSFLKLAIRQKKKKDDMFSYKKWPHYSAAVITNDNILLSISIALSIHHVLVVWQQLSVHPCFFLLVFSKVGNHLIVITLNFLCSPRACGTSHS